MSVKNGVWHDAQLDPPGTGNINTTVLIVKQSKGGERKIGFGAYMSSTYMPISARWSGEWATSNGKGTVLYWMPLPKMPEG